MDEPTSEELRSAIIYLATNSAEPFGKYMDAIADLFNRGLVEWDREREFFLNAHGQKICDLLASSKPVPNDLWTPPLRGIRNFKLTHYPPASKLDVSPGRC